jgi:hypothetical protein
MGPINMHQQTIRRRPAGEREHGTERRRLSRRAPRRRCHIGAGPITLGGLAFTLFRDKHS